MMVDIVLWVINDRPARTDDWARISRGSYVIEQNAS